MIALLAVPPLPPPAAVAATLPSSRMASLRDPGVDSAVFIRINHVGYRPEAPKVAIACVLATGGPGATVAVPTPTRFTVETESGRVVFGPSAAERSGAFGPCVETWRLDFSALRASGRYRVRAGAYTSPVVRRRSGRLRDQ